MKKILFAAVLWLSMIALFSCDKEPVIEEQTIEKAIDGKTWQFVRKDYLFDGEVKRSGGTFERHEDANPAYIITKIHFSQGSVTLIGYNKTAAYSEHQIIGIFPYSIIGNTMDVGCTISSPQCVNGGPNTVFELSLKDGELCLWQKVTPEDYSRYETMEKKVFSHQGKDIYGCFVLWGSKWLLGHCLYLKGTEKITCWGFGDKNYSYQDVEEDGVVYHMPVWDENTIWFDTERYSFNEETQSLR